MYEVSTILVVIRFLGLRWFLLHVWRSSVFGHVCSVLTIQTMMCQLLAWLFRKHLGWLLQRCGPAECVLLVRIRLLVPRWGRGFHVGVCLDSTTLVTIRPLGLRGCLLHAWRPSVCGNVCLALTIQTMTRLVL